MLLGSKLTVKEIAMMTGYNSGLAFAREFQKNYGVRPSLFRKQGE
ncbi:MAG: helix-turn-helix transcriptional regulator [Lentisphaeria bacterium]|nr:helix-turn-helix transcriptional regulator [Lentisphaeria bacterium]